jgi:hypothetical protein
MGEEGGIGQVIQIDEGRIRAFGTISARWYGRRDAERDAGCGGGPVLRGGAL